MASTLCSLWSPSDLESKPPIFVALARELGLFTLDPGAWL